MKQMCPPPTPECSASSKQRGSPTEPIGSTTPKMNSAMPTGSTPPTIRSKSVVKLSPLSIFAVMLGCAVVSFCVGYASRNLLQAAHFASRRSTMLNPSSALDRIYEIAMDVPNEPIDSRSVNLPEIPTDRKAPYNRYTYKHFETTGGAGRSNSMLLKDQCDVSSEGTCIPTTADDTNGAVTEGITMKANVHEPSGQHLLVDIANVDPAFLNSEERLARAMIDLILQSSMTLLSYHCQRMQSQGGVSCVGVLLESHVAFHTWPSKGVIALDIFSCGPDSLLPRLANIQELFGVPSEHQTNNSTRHGRVEPLLEPRMVWSHKRRGFRKAAQYNLDDADIHWILGMKELGKHHVATVKTDYQLIDIYDLVDPRSGVVDRVAFLDGIIQSRGLGEHAYHEALIHPALFAHDDPRRVIIIGAGEGATLREVLKHNTVEEVIMVEIDKGMVDASRMYLPEWSYCGNLVGSADSCFDDPRATVYYTDAIAWFIDRFGANATIAVGDIFDVIIMDALYVPHSVFVFGGRYVLLSDSLL